MRRFLVIVVAVLLMGTAAVWGADKGTSGGSEGASASFNAVDLPDGEYTPDSFSWSGGSGRLKSIDCTRIQVQDGGAYATLVFSSRYYDHVKIMGKKYARSKAGEDSATFRIPVKLNANVDIEGRTTAMSQPHWIPYQIYVGKKGAKADGQAEIDTEAQQKQNAAMKEALLEKPPVIVGGKGGRRIDTGASGYLRIFRYEDDTALIQVARSTGEAGDSLYHQPVVNYLVVPEDKEVPAGTGKDFVVISRGAGPVYTDAPRGMIGDFGVKQVTPSEEEFSAADALKGGTKLCVLEDSKATDELADKMMTVQIPLFIDRSGEEESSQAEAEWALAYGEIFGQRDKAEALVASAETKAAAEKKQQKTAALVLLLGVLAATLLIPVSARRG